MWVRKTPQDVMARRRKLRLAVGTPIMLGAIMFAAATVRIASGPFRPTPARTLRIGNAASRALIIAVIVAVVAYVIQIVFGRPILSKTIWRSKAWICNKCFETKSSDGQYSCQCGGTFEDFEHRKWVED